MRSVLANPHHPSVRRSRSTPLAILLVTLTAIACGNSGTPAVAPTLISNTPLDAAANVALAVHPTATFDRAMAPLNGANFTLKQGSTPVAGTIAMSTDGTTATFTPISALAPGAGFTATITAGTQSALGGSFAADHSWRFNTTSPAGTVAPNLVSTYPTDGATGVSLNSKLSAAFDSAMTPLTAANFTLKQGTTAVAGTVGNSADRKGATFAPSANLAAGLSYTATITGATSAAGVALAAAHSWSFTAGSTTDTTPPVVSATNPVNSATGVAVNTTVAATFSKSMDPQTINATTFTVMQGTTPVTGSVSYGPGTTATFTPGAALSSGIVYTATIATGVQDLSGNALATAYSWSFTTGSTVAKGPAPVLLGAAGNYVVLAQTAISSVSPSALTGDIAVSPAAETYITGFALTDATGYATSTQVVGKVYAADQAPPTPSNLTTAISNMQAAYTDAAGRTTPDFLELGTGNIGGMTLAPGLYKWTSSVTIPSDVTISGGANDTWIFQTTGDLIQSDAMKVTLAGGAQAKNIWWQVAGKASIGAGAHFEGILLVKTQATLVTGATMNGRLLAQTQVALQQATVHTP